MYSIPFPLSTKLAIINITRSTIEIINQGKISVIADPFFFINKKYAGELINFPKYGSVKLSIDRKSF